jgi:peptidoglycan/xylan/chitin deacetylase (PgdA/CDA1 family)
MNGARAKVLSAVMIAISMLAMVLQPVHGVQPDCQKCVAFRLDDIQDFYYSSQQRAFIEMFMQNNASLSIGIIGGGFGNDTEMVNFISQYKNDSKIEIANHGWLHEDFALLDDSASQQELLERTNKKIHDLLGQDVVITTFIAPLNSLNAQTYEAVAGSGLHIISADPGSDTIFANNQTRSSGLYHLPMTVEASILISNDSSWQAVSAIEMLSKIDDSINTKGNAVVMLHPWDSIGDMQSVITHIQDKTDYRIVTLREMAFGENEMPEGLNAAILSLALGSAVMAVWLFRGKRFSFASSYPDKTQY